MRAQLSRFFAALRQWPPLRWWRVVLGFLVLGGVVFLAVNHSWIAEFGLLEDGTTTTRLHRTGRVGMWLGVAGATGIALVLLAGARWWLAPVLPVETGHRRSFGAWFVAGVLGAMLVAGVLAWERMDVGVYNDEEYCLQSFVRGRYQRGDDGELKFRPVTWANTLWAAGVGWPLGNNHVLFSALSRLSLDTWKTLSGQEPRGFSEAAFRFPSWLAGLGCIAFLALLLRRAGHGGAGVAAAWIAALHPWFLRYMADGRGYALMFFFTVAGFYFLLNALQGSRWRWWILYGLAQFLMLASCAVALYIAVVQNLAVALWLAWAWKFRNQPFPRLLRFGVANAVTAAALFLLKTPWLIFQVQYLMKDWAADQLSTNYLQDFWCYLTTGMLHRTNDPENPIHITIAGLAEKGWPAEFVVWVVMPLVMVAGVVRLLWGRGENGALLAVLFVLPAPLAYAQAYFSDSFLFIWYLIFGLPGAVALMALGITWPAAAAKSKAGRVGGTALAAVAILAFTTFTWPQTRVIQHYSKENFREAVEFVRGYVDPGAEREPANLLTGTFWSQCSFYDPHVRFLRRPNYFADIVREAHARGVELFIIYGNEASARKRNPGNFLFVDNPALFEHVAFFPGLETSITNVWVVRYTGADPEPHIPDPLPER